MSDAQITRIYEKYLNTVYKVCFMFLKNEAETEDAVQNVFIKLMNQTKKFESDEHIKAWLIVTAKNECKNVLSHWWKTKRTSPLEQRNSSVFPVSAPCTGALGLATKKPDTGGFSSFRTAPTRSDQNPTGISALCCRGASSGTGGASASSGMGGRSSS